MIDENDEPKLRAFAIVSLTTAVLAILVLIIAMTSTDCKADRETIISAVEKLERDMGANTNYRIDCFKEAMDKTVTDAKGTIEAFHQKRVTEAGVDALANGTAPIPKLIDSD